MKIRRKKNTNTIVFTILIILAILLIGVGLVFVGFSSIKKDNKDNKEEVLELTEEDKIKYGEEIELSVRYFNDFLSHEFPLSNVDNLAEDEKTLFLLKVKSNVDTLEFSVDELEMIKDKYFEGINLFLENIIRDSKVLYGYQNNKFVLMDTSVNNNVCVANSKMVSNKEGVKNWEVKHKVYFIRNTVMPDGTVANVIYTNYNNCEEQINGLLTLAPGVNDMTEEQYEEYNPHFSTYTYKLKRVNDNYLIKSVTIEE